MLFIGGLIIEIAIAVTFLLGLFSTTYYATRLSNQAFVAARAGIEDGMIKVVRDKNCPEAGCSSPYDLLVGSETASVTICKDSCSGVGKTRIESIGAAGTRHRKIQAVLSVNATTGKVDVDSIQEVAL